MKGTAVPDNKGHVQRDRTPLRLHRNKRSSFPPRAQPEPASTLPAPVRPPRKQQFQGPLPPSHVRPASIGATMALRTDNPHSAAATIRRRHTSQATL